MVTSVGTVNEFSGKRSCATPGSATRPPCNGTEVVTDVGAGGGGGAGVDTGGPEDPEFPPPPPHALAQSKITHNPKCPELISSTQLIYSLQALFNYLTRARESTPPEKGNRDVLRPGAENGVGGWAGEESVD